MPRPNFVVIMTDQLRADFLGCYGHPVVRTPHIDGLADRGTRFERFFVNSPVCQPNRASFMTGRMPSSHGVRHNGIPLDRRNVTFVELLADAGYDTALVGKSHLGNITDNPPAVDRPPLREGFHRPSPGLEEAIRHDLRHPVYDVERPSHWQDPAADVPLPFHGFGHVALVTNHGDSLVGHYRRWLLARRPDADRLTGPQNQLPHGYSCPQAVRTALPEELYPTSYVAGEAVDYLRRRAGRAEPFFLFVSFPDPHHPFNPPGRYWDMYDPDEMEIPDAFARNDWQMSPAVRDALQQRAAGKANLGGTRTIACTAREAQEVRALTCGMITMIDDAVGAILAELRALGLAEDTVVAFTSDHGDNLGDHRLLLKGSEPYRQVIRVPFIWCDPARPGGRVTEEVGSTMDIGPTILDRAMVEPCAGLQGLPLGPAMAGTAVRDFALIQYENQRTDRRLGRPPRVHTLAGKRWRLTLYDGAEDGELYDLETDPGEYVNLWDDPGSAGVRADLLLALARMEIDLVDRVPGPTGTA